MPGTEQSRRWRFCIAPMMKYTDRHFRFFARLLTKRARLYTEMVVAPAIVRGDTHRFLAHNVEESPVALQLGGSNPLELARAAKLGEEYGFSEINLNVGCPSDRVQSGEFGACLMAKPGLVADCVSAMKNAISIPVTVKSRIGIDDRDDYEFLHTFAETIIKAEVDALFVHARKAILNGLSPAENRTIPPLHYDTVYRLKTDFPDLPIVINGGVKDSEQCQQHLKHCDGVMIGREACANPYWLAGIDQVIFGDQMLRANREQVVRRYLDYLNSNWQSGSSRQMMIKPLFGLYLGQPGAKQWRRNLNAVVHNPNPPSPESLLTEHHPHERLISA